MSLGAPAIITQWDARRMLGEMKSKGRKPGQTAGTYIDNLVALGKCVSLCVSGCARKFDARGNGYETHPRMPLARGTCDGCHQYSPQNRLFVKRGAYQREF